jgi:hypothetical protein
MSGLARATTSARIAARAICHRFDSKNLTDIVAKDAYEFVALRSPSSAEHDPGYAELGRFPTRKKAEEFLNSLEIE